MSDGVDYEKLSSPLKLPRQERFAQFLAQGNTYEKAYELAGYEPDRSNAYNLSQQKAVKERIKQLQEEYAIEAGITAGQLLRELEQARLIALQAETPQTSAAVSATMGKAKITGMLDKAKGGDGPDEDSEEAESLRAIGRKLAFVFQGAAEA